MIKKLRNDNITITIFIVQSISPGKERRGIIGDYLVFLETATLLGFGLQNHFVCISILYAGSCYIPGNGVA